MKLYRIKDWNKLFENNRTRVLDVMRWVPIPNKQDGEGFNAMIEGRDGPAIYGTWVVILQVASKCHPRGTLMREGDVPYTAATLSRRTHFPEDIIQKTLDRASSPAINWMETVECEGTVTSTSVERQSNVSQVRPNDYGIEGNRIEEKEENIRDSVACLSLLEHLNQKAHRNFQDCEDHRKIIDARLSECKGDVEGCKRMIDRQCALWSSDPAMQEYLQPSTLFAKKHFRGYYDKRDLPVQPPLINGKPRIVADHSKGF